MTYVYLVCHVTEYDYEGATCSHEMVTGSLEDARDKVKELKELIGTWHNEKKLRWHGWENPDENVWQHYDGNKREIIQIESWGL